MIFEVSVTTANGALVETFDVPAPDFMVPWDQVICLFEDPVYGRWTLNNRLDEALHLEIKFGHQKVTFTRIKDE